ncbi:sigma-54-dependent Fis family transcriptional regulator [Wenzhouxiangella marina]|uniref:PAS modulated sigma54 specific transcriptional regulator, Fis family n=1 Tax=Wenzhouxiangella marina TaxID=1579979 RepID=A0A0K0XZQ3_9GAMM|nr:sigma-54-dependent Fis family transcriptional regulator [Wenzhouxiangella marina]AKS43150.1 PAS modulated sigma54 specific transcriptional regulator, Fis family [Wenzhouxiangella marina]MBB6087165.1 DNA-binding NtrC family response regulator [Wenzhouxiangella marina]
MASITLMAHYASGERRYPLDAGCWLIGSHEDCDVLLGDPTVSRRHARLEFADAEWSLEDLGSSNGVQINGEALTGRRRVQPGDRLQFGSLICSLIETDPTDLELAVPAESRGGRSDRPSASIEQRGPTISSDRISRFYFETLPALVRRCTRQRPGEAVVTVVAALADSLGGSWTLSLDGAVQATSGPATPEQDREQAHEEHDWRLARRARQALNDRTYRQIAETILPLIERTNASRSSGRTPDSDTTVPPFPEPVTRHAALLNLYRQAARVATSVLNVLIEGSSGTGKELFARYLHRCGSDGQPLVTLNCASLPQDLLDAELFGIERGVATGVDARPGKFEQADGGVIFLDEIGDMHLATQAKLLRVLQEQEVYRVGGSRPRPARIQVVSATNRDLEAMVAQGEFRLDLYHRIADWTVRLPDLEERAVDIANLAAYFLRRACGDIGQRFGGISQAALDCLLAHRWPGNVRELEREMKRCALFLEPGEALRSDHLDARIRQARGTGGPVEGLKALLIRTEKRAIEQALQLCGGDVAAAADRLGIGKSTLYRQIRNLDIDTA